MNFTQAHNDYLDPEKHDHPIRIRRITKPNKWVQFTKRTNEPKLAWLEAELARHGIMSKRCGESWHAPIMQVKQKDLEAAMEILTPIDDLPDSDPRFAGEIIP